MCLSFFWHIPTRAPEIENFGLIWPSFQGLHQGRFLDTDQFLDTDHYNEPLIDTWVGHLDMGHCDSCPPVLWLCCLEPLHLGMVLEKLLYPPA